GATQRQTWLGRPGWLDRLSQIRMPTGVGMGAAGTEPARPLRDWPKLELGQETQMLPVASYGDDLWTTPGPHQGSVTRPPEQVMHAWLSEIGSQCGPTTCP